MAEKMSITDLLARAQAAGIDISPKDGQINVSMPWNVNNIPDHVKEILREVKRNQSQLLAHFALNSKPVDKKLFISALKLQGIRLTSDPQTGFKMFITKDAPGQCSGTSIKLINLLNEHKDIFIDYLTSQGDSQQPG